MICKNCMRIFEDNLSCCPECGTPIKGSYKQSGDSAETVERIIAEVMSGFKSSEEKIKTDTNENNEDENQLVHEESSQSQDEKKEDEESEASEQEADASVPEEEKEEFNSEVSEYSYADDEASAADEAETADEQTPEDSEEDRDAQQISLADYSHDKTEQEISQIEQYIDYDEFAGHGDEHAQAAEAPEPDEEESSAEEEKDYEIQQSIDESVIEATVDEDEMMFEDFSDEALYPELDLTEEEAEEVEEIEEEFDNSSERTENEAGRERSEEKEASPREKSAMNKIVALMIAVAVFIGGISAVSYFTDFFENDDSIKTVSLSGLSSEETKNFEKYLSEIGIVAYEGFDRKDADVGEFLSLFNPSHPGGLYAVFNQEAELKVNQRDPARRFANDNGDYSFYVISEEFIDPVLDSFGFKVYHGINEKDCYYCDGYYYFRYLTENIFDAKVVAQVESTKRTDDGKYYAECVFYNEQTDKSDMDYLKAYIIFEKVEGSWKINTISHEPIFDAAGVMLPGEEQLSYEIRTAVVENKDESGKVTASWQIEYPYFSGYTKAEVALNQLYETMINGFRAEPSSIKRNMAVVSRVTYNKNGFVSVTEETTNGTAYINETEKDGKTVKTLRFPKRSIQGYTLNIETGENISKKEIFKPEYHIVSKVLYCIWSGYDYTAVLSGEEDDIPEDTNETGRKLYESSAAITNEGYTFYYIDKEARTHFVIIPFDTEGMFRFSF